MNKSSLDFKEQKYEHTTTLSFPGEQEFDEAYQHLLACRYQKALEGYLISALKNYPLSFIHLKCIIFSFYQYNLTAFLKVPEKYLDQKIIASSDWIKQQAQTGNAAAQFAWASCLSFGVGAEKDDKAALNSYIQSAEQKYAPAQYEAACIYEAKHDNVFQAANYYLAAAKQNFLPAKADLGTLLQENPYIRDNAEATEWLQNAANDEDPLACLNLGNHYLQGFGAEANVEQAIIYFTVAAQHFVPGAQENIDRIMANLQRTPEEELLEQKLSQNFKDSIKTYTPNAWPMPKDWMKCLGKKSNGQIYQLLRQKGLFKDNAEKAVFFNLSKETNSRPLYRALASLKFSL